MYIYTYMYMYMYIRIPIHIHTHACVHTLFLWFLWHRLLKSSNKPLNVWVGFWDDDATMLAQKTKVILGYLMYDDKIFKSKVSQYKSLRYAQLPSYNPRI